MNPSSPAADSKNWPDNTKAITATDGSFNSSPSTTGDNHTAGQLNDYASQSANHGTSVGNGSPSSTTNNFHQVQNKAGDATGGLGGGKARGGHS